jgi:IS1 family transposase
MMSEDDKDYIVTRENIVFPKLHPSDLFGHHGSFKEYVQTAKMSGYGLSTEQIADVLERDERTILEWQKALGQKCQSFHLALCSLIGLTLMSLQMDEIWSYLQKKKRPEWLFITLEAKTKFWVNFELGDLEEICFADRTSSTAHRLLRNLVYLMPWGFEHFLLVTTDKLAAYEKARRVLEERRRLADLFEYANCFEKVRYAYLRSRQATSKKETCDGQTKDSQRFRG